MPIAGGCPPGTDCCWSSGIETRGEEFRVLVHPAARQALMSKQISVELVFIWLTFQISDPAPLIFDCKP